MGTLNSETERHRASFGRMRGGCGYNQKQEDSPA